MLAGRIWAVMQSTSAWPPKQCSQPRAILRSQGHFCLLQLGAAGIRIEAGMQLNILQCTGQPPATENVPAKNVHRAEFENPAIKHGDLRESSFSHGGWLP